MTPAALLPVLNPGDRLITTSASGATWLWEVAPDGRLNEVRQ